MYLNLVQIWNFLSVQTEDLTMFVFHMYSDETDLLHIDGLHSVLEDIHGKDYASKNEFKKLIRIFKENLPHADEDDFAQFCKSYASLIDPIKILQLVLRKTLIGDNYWHKMSIRRNDDGAMKRPDYALDISVDAVLSSDAAAKKYHGHSASGGGRRKPKSNKYAVAMQKWSKVKPTLSRKEDTAENIIKQKPRKKSIDSKQEAMVTVQGMTKSTGESATQPSEWKTASRIHPHSSPTASTNNSPRRRNSVDSNSSSPRSPGQQKGRRLSYSV